MKPEGHTETVSDIKPGHPIWDEIYRRVNSNGPDYASHLMQLFEISLKCAFLQQANERMREALEHIVSFGGQSLCGSPEATSANMAYDDCAEIARAALAEAGGETGI